MQEEYVLKYYGQFYQENVLLYGMSEHIFSWDILVHLTVLDTVLLFHIYVFDDVFEYIKFDRNLFVIKAMSP